jgi:ATP phosphoribosyltransferase regulatory subunit
MLPKGVKDFLPIKAARIEYLRQTLHEVFSRWAFRPIIPPSLEYLHVLEKGLGEGLREKTFRFDDRQNGQLIAFSPDITPQVARIFATRMSQAPLPLRLCYTGQVLRHTEQQAGKDREIFQSGVELIGLASPEADAEMIAMAVECLQSLGAEEFTIDIGQVEFFRGVMADLPLSQDLARLVQNAIARKDSSGLRELLQGQPLAERAKEEILALPRLFGGREVLDRAEKVVTNDRSRRALENLQQVLQTLEVYGVEKHVTFDLGELRGLDYHTGVTFQGFLSGLGRAVCSGGRYDNLTARYGLPAPATGFAFNLLNLLTAFDRELDQKAVRHTDVLIFQSEPDKQPAQKAARALRQKGWSAARDIIPRQLEDSIAYAHKMNYRYVMVIGKSGETVRLIRLADGQERPIAYTAALAADLTL